MSQTIGIAIKIIAVGALVAALAALYAAKLLMTEDLTTSRGTFAYYVTIRSSNIKDFPRLGVVGEENYYSSCGDGPKPPAKRNNVHVQRNPSEAQRFDRTVSIKKGVCETGRFN